MAGIIAQFAPLPYPTHSLANQTVIVTGSNTGLGLEAARHFARLNASKVILAVRSLSKGEAARQSITKSTGRDVCEVWQLDLSDFESVKAFAKRASGLERLDVVCENAGIATQQYVEVGGFESTIAVNVVGTFLLALLLLPILRKSGTKHGVAPRLVITSSEVHAWCKFNERNEPSIFDALKKNDPAYIAERYPVSKLLEVLGVYELAPLMSTSPNNSPQGPHVILNTVNPGFCQSELAREATGLRAVMFCLAKLVIARSSEKGSRTIVAAAVAGGETHGKYMSNCVAVESSSALVKGKEGKELQQRVWKELVAVLEEIQPGISKNI